MVRDTSVLKRYAQNYIQLLDVSPNIIYELSSSGEIVALTPSFKRVTGWRVEDWIGKDFSGIIHPDDLRLARETFMKILKGESIPAFRLRVLKKDGSYMWGEFQSSAKRDEDGRITGKVGIVRDVSEEKNEEDRLTYYANIVESADSVIYSKTLDGVITTWNRSAEELFGYRKDEIIGKNIEILVPPEKKSEFKDYMKKIKKGQSIDPFETVRIKKDGTRFPAIVKISVIKNNNGEVIGASGIVRDFTEEKRDNQRKAFLEKATRIVYSSLDYKTALSKIAKITAAQFADLCVISQPEEKSALKGLTANGELIIEAQDKKVKESLMQERPQIKESLFIQTLSDRIMQSGKAELFPSVDSKLLRKLVKDRKILKLALQINPVSAMLVPISANNKTLGAIAFVSLDPLRRYTQQDLFVAEKLARRAGRSINNAILYMRLGNELKQRKKAERDLRNSRDLLDVIFHNVADGITVQDARKLIIVNEEAARQSGYDSAQEMLENPSLWLKRYMLRDINGDMYDLKKLPGRRALLGERDPEDIINFYDKLTGQERWSEVKARPVFDEKGKPQIAINIIHDITERVQTEKRRDDFIRMASHELKTPLTSMSIYAQILRKKTKQGNTEDIGKLADKINDQTAKLANLVSRLLDLSVIQTGRIKYHKEYFSIDKLLKDTVDAFSQTTKIHKIKVQGKTRRQVWGDRFRIYQVLSNLLTNAIKFSPQGGDINIKVKRDKKDVTISVEDNGIGIPKSQQKNIFEKMYQAGTPAGKTYPGLGIGLYISSEIVKSHNGRIWVESREGEGARFYFTLPLSFKHQELGEEAGYSRLTASN